jgi:hypothetical protein
MKKLLLFLSIALITASCSNKGNFSCYCVGPDGTVIAEYQYTGYQETVRTANDKCDATESAWNATNKTVGTQCQLK